VRIDRSALTALALACAACGEGGSSADPNRAMPSAEERLLEWEALPEGTPVPVSLGFGRPLPDSTIAALLTRHSVRPYAVYLVAAGTGSSLQRDRSRASLEVLGEAREQAVAQLRTSLCAQPGGARALLEAGDADVGRARQMLAYVNALQRAVPELEAGAPTIYGVDAVGSVADVRLLQDEPVVVSWEPGWPGSIEGVDTVVTPSPPAPTEVGPVMDSTVLALAPDAVLARLTDLAENGLGSCESATPSDEPR
jgi:hypothetical protein